MKAPQSLVNFPKVAAAPSPRSSKNAASASIFPFANDWGEGVTPPLNLNLARARARALSGWGFDQEQEHD